MVLLYRNEIHANPVTNRVLRDPSHGRLYEQQIWSDLCSHSRTAQKRRPSVPSPNGEN